MGNPGTCRYLRRWGILPESGEFARINEILASKFTLQPKGSRVTKVWVDVMEWIPPDRLVAELRLKQSRHLWRVSGKRGMEGFIFTDDLSQESEDQVADLLGKHVGWLVHHAYSRLSWALKIRKVKYVEVKDI